MEAPTPQCHLAGAGTPVSTISRQGPESNYFRLVGHTTQLCLMAGQLTQAFMTSICTRAVHRIWP